ncbi:Inosine/uridine-preferring nucleoside hydrolase domain-containing protein, partial [Obelidium mucronatum]
MPERVIIDCDVGIDDVTALLMCFKHPEAVTVEAVTIVDGNVSLASGYQTAKLVMSLAQKSEVAVIAGANGPLIRGVADKVCYAGHGLDGLGNFTARSKEWTDFQAKHMPNYVAEPLPPTQSQYAAVELVRRVSNAPGELTLLALGPLTNLAIALSLDPNFLQNLKSLVIMGGSTDAKGNAGSRVAEFNFHCDPEAVHVVFHAASLLDTSASGPKLILVPWETTVDHAFPWTFFDHLLGRSKSTSQTKFAAFLEGYANFMETEGRTAAEEAERSLSKKKAAHEQYYAKFVRLLLCDSYAAACILDPSSVLEYRDFNARIELGGTFSRGLVALSWHGSEQPNCRIIFKMDVEKIEDLFERTFR